MRRTSSLLRFTLGVLFLTDAHGWSVVGLDEVLSPDPEARARAAVDEGNRALIMPLDCSSDPMKAIWELDREWISASFVFPRDDCPELLEDPVYGDRIDDIEKAINSYNRAVEERAREIGMFSVYLGEPEYRSDGQSTAYRKFRSEAPAMLREIAGDIPLDDVETAIWGVQGSPTRLLVTGYGEVSEVAANLRRSEWRRSPFPWEVLEAMHWYPSEQDACYLGEVRGHAAYLLFRDSAKLAVLIVALTIQASSAPETIPQ